MKLYTIGFTKKSAEQFFRLLADNGITRIIDVRLRPDGQLAGFTRQNDLAFFLSRLLACEYRHEPSLAPTAEILSDYRKDDDWEKYAERFESLLDERGMPQALDPAILDGAVCCLLCSEHLPDKCHRRLVAERFARSGQDTQVVHLY